MLVAAGGALGSSLQAVSRLMAQIGSYRLPTSWRWWLLLQVVTGIPLALMLYMMLRGGVLSTAAGAASLNPYGILGLSALVGLFAAPLLDRLNSIAATLFRNDTALERQIDRIGSALGVSTLDNYQGFVCLSLQDREGAAPSSGEEGVPILLVGRSYDLTVWFQKDKPQGYLSDEIRISGGADSAEVEFTLASDSDGASVRRRQESVRFGATESSPRVQFHLSVLDTVGKHEFWVEISQKNRLVHVISVEFEAKGSQGQEWIPT